MAALVELARMLFAANTILEKASSAVGLSKRAALALAILFLEDGGESTMTNQVLQQRFVSYNVSTGLSAKKDASAAKSELLGRKLIEIRGKVSVFGVTVQGKEVVLNMYEAMSNALDELRLPNEERLVLRRLAGLPHPKPPASEVLSKSVRRKSS